MRRARATAVSEILGVIVVIAWTWTRPARRVGVVESTSEVVPPSGRETGSVQGNPLPGT